MIEQISRETALAIEAVLCREFGLILAHKEGPAFSLIGAGFDVASAFGAKVPSGADFVSRTATVLPLLPFRGLPSGLLLLPSGIDTFEPSVRLGLIAHEATHCHQYRNPADGYSSWAWGGLYAGQPEFRAQQEAGGFAAQLALGAFLGTPDDVWTQHARSLHSVTNRYALRGDDVALAWSLLAQDAHSLRLGIVRHEVLRVTLRELSKLQPGALSTLGKSAAARIAGEDGER